MSEIDVDGIHIQNRIRKDLGDIDGLAASIKDNGLIEPIVLTGYRENDLVLVRLVAGERRLTALKKLGFTKLEHGVHYIWRDELRDDDPKIRLLAASIEMEENIRRKDLTWVETVRGKQKLMAIMQELHGVATTAPGNKGFGVRKLAAMLGESPEQTSNDLEMASLVQTLPALASEPSREAAKRKIEQVTKVVTGQAAPHTATALVYKLVITCDSEQQQKELLEQLRGAGLKVIPIVA